VPEDLGGGGASRSTEPAAGSSSGTDVELLYVIESLRTGDQRFHGLFKELISKETSHVKELLQAAISERDKALALQYTELLRRLTELNHAHEQAREKERDFINREAFDTFVLRTSDDFSTLRSEIQTVARAASEVREGAATSLAKALTEQNAVNDTRFSKVENAQARILGGLVLATFIAPLISGLVVYLLTKNP
jgi:hypothetical protein